MNLCDFASSKEGNGNRGRGDVFWKFTDGEDVKGIRRSEESGLELAAQGLDRIANRSETVIRIFGDVVPSGVGVTDLVAKLGHRFSFAIVFLGGRARAQKLCADEVRMSIVK